ncbi:T9SS type A sorting domain-containing protein [Mariniflexile sp. HMF6888]|uniref:T9SS type A sorting domain-containing protein n=1 Tax=Mariniflexile sp. HMF6888 TaxID=3373086 RepID=UPI0037A60DD1
MKTTLLKNFLSVCVLVFSLEALSAQTTWTGATDTDFLVATNWDTGILPTGADNVFIDPSSNNPIISASLSSAGNADDFVSHLTLNPDSNLTIAAKLWIWSSGGNSFGSGTLNIEDGADINIRNQGRFGTNAASPQIVNINGGLVNTKNQLIIADAGDCTFNINGGTVTSTLNGIILGGYAGVGILNLNGGGLKVSGGFPIDEQPTRAGSGYMTIDNGTLELTGDQVSFVEGYVTAGKIKPAAGKQIVVTYDSTAAITYVTATTPLSINDETSIVTTDVNAIGNRIYVSNVKSTSEINIYSITGALVKTFKTNEDTNFSFKSGLWIATVKTLEGQKSIKLLMK